VADSDVGELVDKALEIAAEDVGKKHVDPSDAVQVLDAAKNKSSRNGFCRRQSRSKTRRPKTVISSE